jgi:hypothetical protein
MKFSNHELFMLNYLSNVRNNIIEDMIKNTCDTMEEYDLHIINRSPVSYCGMYYLVNDDLVSDELELPNNVPGIIYVERGHRGIVVINQCMEKLKETDHTYFKFMMYYGDSLDTIIRPHEYDMFFLILLKRLTYYEVSKCNHVQFLLKGVSDSIDHMAKIMNLKKCMISSCFTERAYYRVIESNNQYECFTKDQMFYIDKEDISINGGKELDILTKL